MIYPLCLLLLVVAGFCTAGVAVRAAETAKRAPPTPDVLVVGDAGVGITPEMARPTPGRPIHYLLIGGVEKRFGGVFVDDNLRRKAEVKIGASHVIEDAPESPLALEGKKP